jgi:hypothetical protein
MVKWWVFNGSFSKIKVMRRLEIKINHILTLSCITATATSRTAAFVQSLMNGLEKRAKIGCERDEKCKFLCTYAQCSRKLRPIKRARAEEEEKIWFSSMRNHTREMKWKKQRMMMMMMMCV